MTLSLRQVWLWMALLCLGGVCSALVATPIPQHAPEAQIRAVLEAQAVAWNRGDVKGFMEGYWRSDETLFVGASGIARGWQALLERYERAYPDRAAMGTLTFSGIEIHMLSVDSAYIAGQWHLEREKDRPAGVFTLVVRHFTEGWRIVLDHTSAYAPTNVKSNQARGDDGAGPRTPAFSPDVFHR
ncbi:MAG: YybH family protein [Candidatus Acidiferrales bacterium]